MATSPPMCRQNKADDLFLDLAKSQISPIYARCLANIVEKQTGYPRGSCDLRSPRPKMFFPREKGTDSNAFSRQAFFAAAEHSPRGFRVDGWVLYKKELHKPCNTTPCNGVFERIPSESRERKYFPKIIRKNKAQQEMLERSCNRRSAIQVMKIEQEEYKQRYERDSMMRSITRKREVAAMVENVKRKTEQDRVQQEIDAMASER
ncbi:hypothetical protein EKO04_001220 [Ascochyta lentis]|uniref:Uncharacterized protein n=1 Tax=Ascochyta lentis TaxID=205686 RepID=A0A8H7JBK4_9PLEO|nr:hypothetical protein EKO04_001220 [Ascochyta lentis]